MKMIVESTVKRAEVEDLIQSLELESFSAACCIGGIDDSQFYVRCSGASHGVIVSYDSLNGRVIEWVKSCLATSVK